MSTKRKGPKKAPRRTTVEVRGTKREGEVDILTGVLRLPVRTLACAHDRKAICPHCVEGVNRRITLNLQLATNPVILRLDAWRVSGDSQQRRAAGMENLKTTMAEIQRQVALHDKYVCDGCVHCKENASV